MSESVKQGVLYICPNNCQETWFFQEGNTTTVRTMTEEGKRMEDDHFDFAPAGLVRCYKCRAEAVIKTKTVRTVIEIG